DRACAWFTTILALWLTKQQMDNRYKAKIGISIGDTNGIGPEIIVKTLSDQRILNFCTPVIYGAAAVMNQVRKALSAEHFHYQQVVSAQELIPKKINLVSCWEEDIAVEPGTPKPESGKASLDSLLAA